MKKNKLTIILLGLILISFTANLFARQEDFSSASNSDTSGAAVEGCTKLIMLSNYTIDGKQKTKTCSVCKSTLIRIEYDANGKKIGAVFNRNVESVTASIQNCRAATGMSCPYVYFAGVPVNDCSGEVFIDNEGNVSTGTSTSTSTSTYY